MLGHKSRMNLSAKVHDFVQFGGLRAPDHVSEAGDLLESQPPGESQGRHVVASVCLACCRRAGNDRSLFKADSQIQAWNSCYRCHCVI